MPRLFGMYLPRGVYARLFLFAIWALVEGSLATPCGLIPNSSGIFRDIRCFTGAGARKKQWATLTYAVPSQCAGGGSMACGLIMDLHGATMSGPIENNNTNMQQLGLEFGYVVLTPSVGRQKPPFDEWNTKTHPALLSRK